MLCSCELGGVSVTARRVTGARSSANHAATANTMTEPSAQKPGSGKAADVPSPRPMMDGAAWFFVVLALISASALVWVKGFDALLTAGEKASSLLLTVAPMILVGLFLGGLVKEITDPQRIAPILGTQSGVRGLVIATLLGAATPGGPFAAFPIVYALSLAGADIGAVIAYLTAWSVLGLHRLVIWELPLLGSDFVIARMLASLPLPIVAGLVARILVNRLPNIPIGREGSTKGNRSP